MSDNTHLPGHRRRMTAGANFTVAPEGVVTIAGTNSMATKAPSRPSSILPIRISHCMLLLINTRPIGPG